MNKLVLLIVILFTSYSCKNTATYPISEPSAEMMDDRVAGKWKMIEDPVPENYYEVYRADKVFKDEDVKYLYHIRFWNRKGTNPTFESNLHFSKINKELFINLPYWQARAHINHKANMSSELYMHNPDLYDTTIGVINDGFFKNFGYFLVKVLEFGEYNDKITLAVVGDPSLRSLNSQQEVYDHVAENMNKPAFYSDTVHLYKIGE